MILETGMVDTSGYWILQERGTTDCSLSSKMYSYSYSRCTRIRTSYSHYFGVRGSGGGGFARVSDEYVYSRTGATVVLILVVLHSCNSKINNNYGSLIQEQQSPQAQKTSKGKVLQKNTFLQRIFGPNRRTQSSRWLPDSPARRPKQATRIQTEDDNIILERKGC